MKKLVIGIATGFLVANAISTTQAGFMDESNCLRGSGIAFDMADAIDNIDKRLVACVNHLQTKAIDNHNTLADAINKMGHRLSTLENSVSRLEITVSDLEK